ncbi:amino acid permease [Candidatus Woesearchaeota archaeon]|nr:amino acid permease [Candidatus Woesearchaeota archaeon]
MGELKKVLNYKLLVLLTLNAMMGTGIYFLPAMGAKYAGPASMISWLILSAMAIYVATCFAELTSMFPKAGGVYEFTKQTFGRFFSFMIGWITWLIANITTAMLIVGAIQYLFPYPMYTVKVAICLMFLFIFSAIAYFGMRTSAVMLATFATINISIIVIMILSGLTKFSFSNYVPFFVVPFHMTFLAVFYIVETFFGWETTTFLAEETSNPERDLPRALVTATIVLATLTILLAFVSMGVIRWNIYGNSNAPLADVAGVVFGPLGKTLIGLGTYLVIIGAAAGWIVSTPRLIMALTRDKLFLSQFKKIHPKYNSPYKAIIFQGFATAIFIMFGFGSFKTLLELLVPLVLFLYSVVLIMVARLRREKPHLIRHFKAPGGRFVPYIIVGIFLVLTSYWVYSQQGALRILFLGASFVLLGVPMYFLIELYNDPKMIMSINDAFAQVHLVFESFNLPKPIRKEILQLLGDLRGKTVLEFGCNVGTLTLHLAEEVGPTGKVYATNISENELKITEKRLEHKRLTSGTPVLSHVELIYDVEHTSRVHPSVGYIDCAVSVGMLSYLSDVKKVLRELNALLPEHGRICFVEYVNYFHILPDVEWLSNPDTIKRVFREAGFSVHVKKKPWLFWNYLFIYGIKSKEELPFI